MTKPPGLAIRGHFAQRIKRANEMAEQKPAVDHVEMIARQAGER